jgi:hypothetical protein
VTRHRRRTKHLLAPGTIAVLVGLMLSAAAAPSEAQSAEWKVSDNPYQEDVAYRIGDTFKPGVVVEGVRWHSFTVAAPDRGPTGGEVNLSTDLTVEFENRGTKSAKVLVILLLEDADGNPLERVEVRQFKVASGRMKERTENVVLSSRTISETERTYLFFEVMD